MVRFGSAWDFISKDWGETLKFAVLGGLLLLIPFIGVLVFAGLQIKILASIIKKQNKIPVVFTDFGGNLLEGLKISAFYLLFGILISLIITGVAGGAVTTIITAATTWDQTIIMNAVLGMIGVLIPTILIILTLSIFFVPALICNYASTRRFSAFFEFGKAWSTVSNSWGSFFKMALILISYSIILGIITGVLGITFIGSFFMMPIALLINSKIIGDWFVENAK